MSIFTRPLAPQRAATALTDYFRQAGIERPEDQLAALRRHYAVTLRDMLSDAGLAGDLTIYDVTAGQEILITQLEPQP